MLHLLWLCTPGNGRARPPLNGRPHNPAIEVGSRIPGNPLAGERHGLGAEDLSRTAAFFPDLARRGDAAADGEREPS
jgi:hypothetical protein